MKKTVQIAFLLFFYALVFAQGNDQYRIGTSGMSTQNNDIRDYANNWKNNINRSVSIDDLKKDVKGSPYYDDKFYSVKINGGVDVPQKLRYNAFSDQMEYMQDQKTYEINKFENLIVEFPSIKKTYVVLDYPFEGKKHLGYLAVDFYGKNYGLYTKERIELKGGTGADNGIVDNTGYRFAKKKDIFYIRIGDKIELLPGSTKEFNQKFTNDRSIANYLNNNKIDLKNKENVIKMLIEIDK